MKIKVLTSLTILAMLIVSIGPGQAFAGSYETAFATSIVYQNIGDAATTTLTIFFYESPDDTTPIPIPRDNLAAGAGTSVAIGSLAAISPNFRGTAVLSADQPMAATLAQNPQSSTTVKVAPLSSGFSDGTPNSLIATVLKNAFASGAGAYYTVFSVQNAGQTATTVDIKFYNTSGTLVHTINDQPLQPGAGYVVDAGQVTQLGTSFNGSVVAESAGGSIVSSAMELESSTLTGAKAFEGTGQGAMTYYMPSAACLSYQTSTAFAVQNTSLTTPTDVTIYYNGGGQETKVVQPGSKQSFITCNIKAAGYLGSAKIVSEDTAIIAMGKLSGAGASTAYLGFDTGYNKLAMPYVRWANSTHFTTGWMGRTNIAIQNVGTTSIPSGTITVKYIDRNGAVLGTHTINQSVAAEGKVSSNASMAGLTEFGCYTNCTQFGGSAIIEGPVGSQLAVIGRYTYYITNANEDYNATPMN